MRNVWKGLAMGAFAGAAVGIVLDGFRAAADASTRAASEISHRARTGATHLAEKVEEKVDEIDTGELVKTAKKGIDQAVDLGKDVAKSTRKQGAKAIKQGRKSAKKGIDQAVDRGKEMVEIAIDGAEEAVDQAKKVLSRT